MSEKHVSWYRRLNGGLWQSEVEHGTLPERRDSFEDGTNFDTTFGYPTKRGGYTRLNASPPGSACIKSNFQKKARAHVQFGDKKLGGTPGEFVMGISFKVPDEFRLEANQCAPILMRPGPTTTIGPTTYYHEFMCYLTNVAGTPNMRLQVMTYDPVGGTYENKTLSVAFADATLLSTGGWHRIDFQYWVHAAVGHISAIVDGDNTLYAQVDFSAAHYWLDTAGDANKYYHAGEVYIGGLPGSEWDKYLAIEGLIHDIEFAEFRYDETAYYSGATSSIEDMVAAAPGEAWINARDIDADVVTHLDESGGMLLAGSGTEWELPGAINNSRPSWQPDGGLTMLGGTWRENPGFVILETGGGKTPLSSIFGPDSSQLLPEWTMHFRFIQPPYIGQDDEWDATAPATEISINVIASQGFIDLETPANDQSPSGWALAYRKAGAGWALVFYLHVSNASAGVWLVNIADPTAVAGEVWVTVRRDGATIKVDSTYGTASAAFLTTQTTQLDGTEPLVFGAQFATMEDYKNFRFSYPQAMLTLKEFRALPYAVNDERVAATEWRTEYQAPHRDYLALFHFREGQGVDLIDFSNYRLRGRILESGVNETYLSAAAIPGAPGTPALWAHRRYGDLMPMSWTRSHPEAATSPIDAVTIYHHPQLGDTRVAIGDGHAWEIDGTTLTSITAEYGSIEVPKPGTLDYTQYGGRVYVTDGANRPQVLEAGRFRPAGLKAPSDQAKPGVLAYPGSDVTGYVTYMMCYENVEAGVISDGLVTDPVYLDNCGALVGWDAEAAAIQGIPCSELAAAPGAAVTLSNGGAVTTWVPDATVGAFTWEGMVRIHTAHVGAATVLWEKMNGAAQPIISILIDDSGADTQLQPWIRNGGALTQLAGITVPSIDVWHHYAWVYDGTTTHRFYVDGRLYMERSAMPGGTTPAIPANNAAGPTNIYYNVANEYTFAEWRFWNLSRTEEEVANQFHVSLKSAGNAALIFNLSPKSTSLYYDEVYRHNNANGAANTLQTGIIDWLGAPDYSLFSESRDKYAPLPLAKELVTHLRFYRSSPHALGATPTPAEVEEAKQAASTGPWRYVGRAEIGDTYWVDRTYQDTEGTQIKLGETETPPLGAYYVERFGAMMAYARTDLYPERIWVSRLWAPEMIPGASGWVDIDDGSGEPISGLASFGDKLYVFKPTSIWAITGAESSILSLNLVSRGQGCVANRSTIQAMGRLWLWTSQGPGVLDGGNVVSLSMPITAEIRKMYDVDTVIGVSDPKRHRVGWLVQQDPDVVSTGAMYSNNENSAILWYDYVYQIWSKHTWAHKFYVPPYADALVMNVVGLDCMFNNDAVVRGHDAQEHEICIVDSRGYIYQYDPTTEIDGYLGKDLSGSHLMTSTVQTATITGYSGLVADTLAGLPVLLICTHLYIGGVHVPVDTDSIVGFPIWCSVKSNTTTTITLDVPAIVAGKTLCYVGAINHWLQHAWSDGGQPLKGKIFERFYWRPTTYNQTWFAYVYIQRSMANYGIEVGDNPVMVVAKIPGDGRFQMELFEQGARLKWALAAPIPGVAGLQEAGWQGRILGDLIPHTTGTAEAQNPNTLSIWPGDDGLGTPGATDEGAVPPAGEL